MSRIYLDEYKQFIDIDEQDKNTISSKVYYNVNEIDKLKQQLKKYSYIQLPYKISLDKYRYKYNDIISQLLQDGSIIPSSNDFKYEVNCLRAVFFINKIDYNIFHNSIILNKYKTLFLINDKRHNLEISYLVIPTLAFPDINKLILATQIYKKL